VLGQADGSGQVPEGRQNGEQASGFLPSLRDSNLGPANPALKRWATINRPCGTLK
jgi:hypothetical protein